MLPTTTTTPQASQAPKRLITPPPPPRNTNGTTSVANNNEHLGASRQYWRDIILGVNDGLVSTFLLVAGVSGGGLSSRDILLTALAGALAGAVSMAAGEYIATKSQNEVMHGEIALETLHIAKCKDRELTELNDLFDLIGIPPTRDNEESESIREVLLHHYRDNPEALLKIMVALEFGVIQDEVRSPLRAALFSGLLFVAGALPSVLPFLFSSDNQPIHGLIAAAIASTIALLIVGAVKTWATRGNCVHAAMENLVIAGLGGGFAYGVGLLFDSILR